MEIIRVKAVAELIISYHSTLLNHDLTPVVLVAHIDTRIRVCPALEINQGADRHIQIQLAALFLIAYPRVILRLQQIHNLLQTLCQCCVFLQQRINHCRITRRMQTLIHACPSWHISTCYVRFQRSFFHQIKNTYDLVLITMMALFFSVIKKCSQLIFSH